MLVRRDMRELAHMTVRAKPDGQMELPEPRIGAPWVLFVLERTVLSCKQKWALHQVFKMLGAWSTAKGSGDPPWVSQLGHLEHKARRCKSMDLAR